MAAHPQQEPLEPDSIMSPHLANPVSAPLSVSDALAPRLVAETPASPFRDGTAPADSATGISTELQDELLRRHRAPMPFPCPHDGLNE